MMHILIVDIHVKPELLDAFLEASLENARGSIQEPGILRFDLVQDQDDPAHILIYEVYRAPEDHGAHRETAHYLKWRDTVTDMMSAPRVGIKCRNLFPDDASWG